MDKDTVVLGFLGTQVDRPRGRGAGRWDYWRPSVGLCQHEDLVVHRLLLLAEPRYTALFTQVQHDIRSVSPETKVELVPFPLHDPWDFEEVFERLYGFAREFPFDPIHDDYLVHI